MNKFNIKNMRFRILKGGKIGLAASIAMIGGVLTFGSINANATNYFTTTNAGLYDSTSGTDNPYSTDSRDDNILTYQVANNVVSNNETRSLTSIDDVYFDPTSFATSWYSGGSITDYSDNTVYALTTGSSTLDSVFNLTFSSGSNSNNITKNTMSIYSASSGTSFGGVAGIDVNLTETTGVDYTANLIFNGSNTVSGYTDIDAGSIVINGGANFAGTVQAGLVDINTSSLVTFNSLVDLSPGDTDTLTFNNGGEVRLNNGLIGDVDFNGQNAKIVLSGGNITGSVDTSTAGSGTLSFTTNGTSTVTGSIGATETLKEISIDGTGRMTAGSNVATNLVTFNSAGTFAVTGDLNTTKADNSVGNVVFNEVDASLEVGGNLTANVSTVNNNQGNVTMTGDIQSITGSFGTSSKLIGDLNIASTSTTTSEIDLYATSITLNSDNVNNSTSQLIMTNGADIFSDVKTAQDNTGILTFNSEGSYQYAEGQVGTSSEKLAVVNSGANNIVDGNSVDRTSTAFEGDVYATTLNNTGTGRTVLQGNFTGTTVNFLGDGEIQVYNNKTITAAVKTDADDQGTLSFLENATMIGDIGENASSLKLINIADNNQGSVTTDTIYATNTSINNDGTLIIRVGKDINGNVITETSNTGTLDLSAGGNTVNGNIGTSTNAIKTIEAGTNATTTLNGMVNAQTLSFVGDEIVVLNGDNADDANIEGMIGTVDLNNTNGTLSIGDDVNLTTVSGIESDTNGIQFDNANNAILGFDGTSTVTGVLGGETDGRSTFEKIYAGADNETVTFKNDVFVEEGTVQQPTTFHVYGEGTVNFEGNLNGDLVFNDDGIVNVSNEKSITVTTAPLSVYTSADDIGTLNFLGSTTLSTDIGASGSLLKAVNFNNDTISSTQTIDKSIYATTTTIGGTSDTTALALTDVSGTYDFSGGNTINEFTAGGTIANITEDITFGGDLVLANDTTAVNFGTSHVNIVGDFDTNGAGMSFIVDTADITGVDNAVSSSDGSALVNTDILTMANDEKIHINYVGSLADNGTYTLIDTAVDSIPNTYSGTETNGLVTDNSYSVDTTVERLSTSDDSGDLILYADRTGDSSYEADELYVVKSDTSGHFSNNAAEVIAGIAANGSQAGDMIEVIQKLELDSFGFGNSKENLAVQVKKLAPIVNTSFVQTSVAATNQVTNSVGSRISDVSGLSSGDAVADIGVWGKISGSSASQDSVGQYDGYSLTSGGVVFGIDKELKNGLIFGMASGFTYTKTEQDDFRSGDTANTDSYQVSLYASKTYKNAYVDGTISYTKHNTEGTRTTAVDRVASYDIDTAQLSAKISGGYNFNVNGTILTPYASLEHSKISQDDYTETGAGSLNLSVDDINVNRSTAGLGLKVSKEIKTDSISFTPELNIGAKKYFGDDNVEVSAQFDQGEKFVTRGADMIDLTYNAGLGLTTTLSDNTDISFSSDYERSSDGDFQGVNGQLSFRMQF